MAEFFLTSFATLFVVVDPVALLPLFMALTERDSDRRRSAMATRAVLFSSGILLVFLFGGIYLLAFLGITMFAFQIAGGVLLFLLAVEMVFARRSGLRATTAGEHSEGVAKDDISVFPLAFPLLAGPGAITTVLLLVTRTQGQAGFFLAVLAAIAAVMAIALGLLLLASRLTAMLGETGANVFSRVLGLILAALAAQYVIDGILGVAAR